MTNKEIDQVVIDGGLVSVSIGNDSGPSDEMEAEVKEEPKEAKKSRMWFGRGKKKKDEKKDEEQSTNDILKDLELGVELDEEKEDLKLDVELDIEDKTEVIDVNADIKSDVEEDAQKDVEKDIEKDIENEDKDATVGEKSGEDPEETESEEKQDLSKTLSNFGEKLLNVCTFGLLFSAITATDDDPVLPAEKMNRSSTVSIPGSNVFEQRTLDSGTNRYEEANDRSAIVSTYSSHGGESNVARLIPRLTKLQRREKTICLILGIIVFFGMAALFAIGGTLLKRNGW